MTKKDILNYLEENKNERGIQHWRKEGVSGMSSVGIGVTLLKSFAKKVGKNNKLALELWNEPIFESKILATLVDDPKIITREQINKQVKDLNFWMLSHAYCNYLLPKYPGIQKLAEDWINCNNDLERRCGFLLYYQIAKSNKNLPDEYFFPLIERIEKELQLEENFVKDVMNNALWGIGMRSKILNDRCIKAANKIGKVKVNYGHNSCEAINVTIHLTSERTQKKFKT
jgi:3-methyladenine DNA glycosylase AlkD